MKIIKNNICIGCENGDCNKKNHKERCKYAKKEQLILNTKIRQKIIKIKEW